MNKIGLRTYISYDKEYLIVTAADIEGFHDPTLDRNALVEKLQCIINTVKFWCVDNYIIKNVTLQLFTPISQACQLKG